MTNKFIVDRQVPERTNLSFYFPKPTQGEEYYIVRLPFFENIIIKETKKARYQKYSLISRSSNLYSYLGADSRQLSLSFNMTMPHILEEHPGLKLEDYIDFYTNDKDNLEAEKKKFKEPYTLIDKPGGVAWELGINYLGKEEVVDSAKGVLREAVREGSLNIEDIAFLAIKYGLEKDTFADQMAKRSASLTPMAAFSKVDSGPLGALAGMAVNYQEKGYNLQVSQANQNAKIARDELNKLKYRIIDIIIYWTNIIRASVANNAQNPIYGPPIIRLNHGILYQDIPCICTNYSINYNEAAGYDMDTLLPRQLQVSMKLEEIRTGDFGVFSTNVNDVVKRDNLAGWEAVVLGDSHSMDPGGGVF